MSSPTLTPAMIQTSLRGQLTNLARLMCHGDPSVEDHRTLVRASGIVLDAIDTLDHCMAAVYPIAGVPVAGDVERGAA